MAFIKNAWYVCAWQEEVRSNVPLARTLLGEPLVMFAGENRQIAALVDRCPHRGVPLSMGTVEECRIQCPYHGLAFDATGTCVRNPHVKGNPSKLRTGHHATECRHGAVWLWNGDASEADPSKIPDFSFLEQPGYAVIRGLMRVKANFRLVLDNLLDLSHAEYIHQNTVGTPGASTSVRSTIALGADRLTVKRKLSDLPPSAVFKPYWNKSDRIDQYSNMSWFAPSNFKLNLGLTAPDGQPDQFDFEPDAGFHFPSAHLLTPESENSTLYFYAIARNFMTDDADISRGMERTFVQTFEGEDRPVLEAIQNRLDGASESGFKFADFTVGDGAASQARRIIERLIADEDVLRTTP